jgi:hypothetical protein
MRRAVFAVLLVLAACHARPEAPPWAELQGGVAGDGTVQGAPAPVPRLAAPPTIDGRLDDAVWSAATVLGPFVDPGDGAAAAGHPVAGAARVGWDDGHLYIAFVVRDRDPRSRFERDADDPHIWSESSGVEIMLQPGEPSDNRDYYEIQVDVAGAVFDSHFDDYNVPVTGAGAGRIYGHQDWSSRIERSARRGEGFWSVEIALPFAALVPSDRAAIPPRPGDVWRMNLYSFRDGQQQALAWSPLRRQGNFHKAARFGRIQFQ